MKKNLYLRTLAIAFGILISVMGSQRTFAATEEMGFVEYNTQASINFEEVVEVVLTNAESGHYYTHKLYRINDYYGNFTVPFGTYSVSARVITEEEETLSQYSVACLTEKIEVKNQNIAVPITLRVDEFALGDVTGGVGDGAEVDDPIDDDWPIPDDPDNYEPVEDDPGLQQDPSTAGTEDDKVTESDDENSSKGGSILWSLFISLLMLGVCTVVAWFFFRAREGGG